MAAIEACNLGFTPTGETERAVRGREHEDSGSRSSSSIGRNSDASGAASSDSGETEVQSSDKGPLETMDALEEVFPLSRGISKFYGGKSKSFTSLADLSSSSSIQEIRKPENAYSRKRKSIITHGYLWGKNYNYPLRSNIGRILKKAANSSRSTLALAATISSLAGNSDSENSNLSSFSTPRCLPPLHPQSKRSPSSGSFSPPALCNSSPWRSLSLSDLQHVAAAVDD